MTSIISPLRDRARQSWPMQVRQLRMATWGGVLTRAGRGFLSDNCTDLAAALTYYGVLALFPAAIVVVALVGLVADGQDAFNTIVNIANDLAPRSSVESLEKVIQPVVQQDSSAKVLLSFGLVGAIWSASAYVGAYTRAANTIYKVHEGRPFYLLRPLQLLVTLAALVLLAVVAVGLLVSGPVASAVGDALHVGTVARTMWSIGRWPVLALVILFLLSMLGWIAPNVRQPRLRWLTVGGAVTLVTWALASLGFGVYVSHFSSYDVTYGSLGTVVAFLVWLYLSNCAVLLGVEINAELQRGRRLQGGEEAETGPALPPRIPADD